jgi:hypothetical protein
VTLNDLHQLDLVTMQWTEIGRDLLIPEALPSQFGFGFTAVGRSLYVFGGISQNAGAQLKYRFYQTEFR